MIQGEDQPMLEDKRESEVAIRSKDTQVTAVSTQVGGIPKILPPIPRACIEFILPREMVEWMEQMGSNQKPTENIIFQVVHEIQAIREAMGGLGNRLSNLAPYVQEHEK